LLCGETGKREREPVIKKLIFSSPLSLSFTKLFSHRLNAKERKKRIKNKLNKKSKSKKRIRSRMSRLP
jgi:hypothetical protein